MSERCEWNPISSRPASDPSVPGDCPNDATVCVGRSDPFHLCASCAALPAFARRTHRSPLGSPATTKKEPTIGGACPECGCDGTHHVTAAQSEPAIPLSEHQRVLAEAAAMRDALTETLVAEIAGSEDDNPADRTLYCFGCDTGAENGVITHAPDCILAPGAGSGWLSPQEAERLRAERDDIEQRREEAVKWIGVVGTELVLAGFEGGDRDVALANLRKLVIERDTLWGAVDALLESATEQQEALEKANRERDAANRDATEANDDEARARNAHAELAFRHAAEVRRAVEEERKLFLHCALPALDHCAKVFGSISAKVAASGIRKHLAGEAPTTDSRSRHRADSPVSAGAENPRVNPAPAGLSEPFRCLRCGDWTVINRAEDGTWVRDCVRPGCEWRWSPGDDFPTAEGRIATLNAKEVEKRHYLIARLLRTERLFESRGSAGSAGLTSPRVSSTAFYASTADTRRSPRKTSDRPARLLP